MSKPSNQYCASGARKVTKRLAKIKLDANEAVDNNINFLLLPSILSEGIDVWLIVLKNSDPQTNKINQPIGRPKFSPNTKSSRNKSTAEIILITNKYLR